MTDFLVLKVSSGSVPSLGGVGSADVYRGDHVSELAAVTAAQAALKVQPGTYLYALPSATPTRYALTITAAVG